MNSRGLSKKELEELRKKEEEEAAAHVRFNLAVAKGDNNITQ